MSNPLVRFFKKIFNKTDIGMGTSFTGSQRPLSNYYINNNYDLEIQEVPIRDAQIARALIEMKTWSYETRHALRIIADDCFASDDGDDQGYGIAKTLDDQVTPVNPEVYSIATDLINRMSSHEEQVIGGDQLKLALKRMLVYGDCFLELGIEKEGIGRNDYGISKTLYLPTWEMFRQETAQGQLYGFQQRKYISSKNPDYFFYPPQIIHFRNERETLYGISIYQQSLGAWAKVKEAGEYLHLAARDLGVNPNLHIMPPDATTQQKKEYINNYETKKQDGFIHDLYLSNGQDVKKLGSIQPTLQPLINNFIQWRYRTIPPGVPIWFFPGLLDAGGSRAISQAPELLYARMRYAHCAALTKGIKQAINTEIILKKGWDWFRQNGKYRIVWPHWDLTTNATTPFSNKNDTMTEPPDAEGIIDLEHILSNGKYNVKT